MSQPVKKIRNKVITFQVTEEEEEQLQWAANEHGIPRASYIRMIALKDAKKVIS